MLYHRLLSPQKHSFLLDLLDMIPANLQVASKAALLGIFFLAGEPLVQFKTVQDIPPSYFTEKRVIAGRVEKVIDGDTLRITHCPTYFACPDLDKSKRLDESTLKIRAYGIDTPELKKRDQDPPSQPFAQKAKQFTSLFLQGKTVNVKLLGKDQYGRAIGEVLYGNLDLSIELAERGLATIYTGKGALYDDNKEFLLTAEQYARQKHLGIWSLGDEMVTPGEFKRASKQIEGIINR